MTRQFTRTIGIDYSGAETARSSLKGLSVYESHGGDAPREVLHPASPKKYWTRRGIAEWLVEQLSQDVPTLVGIDHAFSFPLRYFEAHELKPDWPAFLDDFQRHWPTDEDNTYVDFVREGVVGNGAARNGDTRWRRLTEERAGRAKSVFHFDVQGSVAKSTHAGIPWLRFLRARLGGRVHFWPFDGWEIPAGRSVILEVYPALWKNDFARGGRNDHQHDAYCIASTLARMDRDGTLGVQLAPELTANERTVAQLEGWILGVGGPAKSTRRSRAQPRVDARAHARDSMGAQRVATDAKPRNRLADAFAYVCAAHAAQFRKGTDIPYISHLMSVSALVMENGGDEDQAIAGLLHDTIEDCGREHESAIRAQFGDRVVRIVLACTDGVPDAAGKKPPWRERKERYLAHLQTANDDTLLVSACDKLHNARAIAADLAAGADVFARFKAGRDGTLWYYNALVRVFRAQLGEAHPLVRELESAVAKMR